MPFKKLATIIISLVATILFILGGSFLVQKILDNGVSGTGDNYITINGIKYREKNLANFLIVGLDSDKPIESNNSYVNAIQADYIAVLSMDYINKEYFVYSINRDTMCEVSQYDILGNITGITRYEQIALSHGQGDGAISSIINVRRTVENLLYNVRMDYYISLNTNAVEIISDEIGGVAVTMDKDYTSLDSRYEEGETIVMNGREVTGFVQSRMGVEDSTNISRIQRQNLFVDALVNKLKNIDITSNVYEKLYKKLTDVDEKYLLTDVSSIGIANFAEDITSFKFKGLTANKGTANYDNQYVEYYQDEISAIDFITKHYLEKIS